MAPPDRVRPGLLVSRQRVALGRFLRDEVAAFSPRYRAAFAAAGIGGPGRHDPLDDLRRLPPASLADIGADEGAVLVPTAETIAGRGGRDLRWRWRWAGLTGRRPAFVHDVIDPLYKPVHWDSHSGVPVASTATDLERLGDVGRRTLAHAGVRPDDVAVNLCRAGPDVAFWQLVLGCRDAGVAAVHLGGPAPVADIAPYEPTVLAGRPADLCALLAGAGRAAAERVTASLRVVLTAGDHLDAATRDELAYLVPDASVVQAWAPPGVRALWAECHQGAFLHTWPDTEILEHVDGQLVWTGIGWRGTAIVRLATGVAGTLETGACPACGRTTPRVEPHPVLPRAAARARRVRARPSTTPGRS